MTGSSAGSIIGMVVGGIIGTIINPGAGTMLGMSLGGFIGGLGGMAYDAVNPREVINEQDSIADIVFQTSTYGAAIPQIAGRYRLAGNIIDMGQKIEHEHRERQEGGKGGGGTRQISITKTYSVSLHIALCDTLILGIMHGIARAWADNTLIYDYTQCQPLPRGWTFYRGLEDGEIDPTFETLHGAGNEPGYPHTCRVVMEDYDMGSHPRVPNFTFELYQDGAGGRPLTQVTVSPADGDVWVAIPRRNEVWRYNETTRERIAVVTVSTAHPFAKPYGFNLFWFGGKLYVTHQIDYSIYRIDPATNLVDLDIGSDYSLLSNQVDAGSYRWVGTLRYDSDEYILAAYDDTGFAALGYNQDLEITRDWWKIAVSAGGGSIWTISDAQPGDDSAAVRINPANGDAIATIVIGDGKELKDIFVDPNTGHVWVCNYTDGNVARINPATNTVIALVTTGAQPLQTAVASDGYLWVACASRVATRINPADNSTQTFDTDTPNVTSPNNHIWAQGPAGAMWLCCTDEWTVQRISSGGDTLSVRTGANPRDIAAGTSNTVWVVCLSGDIQQIQDDGTISKPQHPSTSGLQDVVGKLNQAVGIAPAHYDVDALPNAGLTFAILNVAAARAALEQLAQAYNFQVIESNMQLVYKLRGREAVVVTIPEDDLLAASAGEDVATPGLRITRIQEAELPTSLALSYTSPTRNYQANTQTAWVSNSRAPSENGRATSTTVGLSDIEGKTRAQELLDRLWVEKNTYQAAVGRKYAHLQPMDRIQIVSRGVQHTMTLTQASYGRPGVFELQGKSDSSATQYVIGDKPGGGGGGDDDIGFVLATTARLLNLPAMNANDQAVRYHVAYQGQDGGWPGATLHRSVDAGTSYTFVHGGIMQGYIGTALTVLPDADAFFTDVTSTVNVYFPYGTLASVTDAVFDGGGGILAMLGDELIYAKHAVLVAADTYQLSYLYRGRRGTEHQTDSHVIDELFIVIDQGVYTIPMVLGDRHVARKYKAVTNGLTIAGATAQDFTPNGSNLVLWSVFPDTEQDGADWVFSWYGRARFTEAWIDGDEASPDPDFLHYRLQIFSDGTYTTVVRTIDQNQGADFQVKQTYTYSSADQTTDLGSPQTTIFYRVFQVGTYGLGQRENLVAA